ncbi:hypothetical protein APHAL10511_008151 [Amanita phalloides]|nr:hypothetical protein APHAL10511_008151 [Amanita phalloides]
MQINNLSASDIAAARSAVGLYALSLYEFLLLLNDECRLIYKSQWNVIKAIYMTSRFMTLVSWPIIIFILVTDVDGNKCSAWYCAQSMIYVIMQNLPYCFLLMRTWVFSGRKRLLAWLLSIGFLTYFAASIWSNVAFIRLGTPRYRQHCSTHLAAARREVGFVVYGAIGLDIIAAAVVIYYYVRDPHIRGDLGNLCFIQAITYLFIMLIINVFTTYTNVFQPKKRSATHTMALMVPNLLACRFILGLRREVNPTTTQLSDRLSVVVNEGIENIVWKEADVEAGVRRESNATATSFQELSAISKVHEGPENGDGEENDIEAGVPSTCTV